MRKILLYPLLLLIISLPLAAQKNTFTTKDTKPGRKIKQVTGISFDEYKKDTVIVSLQLFDKNGNMTEQQEPLMYCGEQRQYDSIGRITLLSVMCGESSGNGDYHYTYKNNKTTIAFSGGAWESKEYKTYNSSGRLSESEHIRNIFSDIGDKFTGRSCLHTQYEYAYNTKRLLQNEKIKETYIYEDLENKSKPDTSIMETSISYYYTSFDSLTITVDKKGKLTETDSITYDPFLHRRTNEYTFYNSPDTSYIHDHILYEYDAKGNLRSKRLYVHCSKKSATEVLAEKEEYRNGLLIKKTSFDVCTRKITEMIHYSYQYWD